MIEAGRARLASMHAPGAAGTGDAEDEEASHALEWPVDENVDGELGEELDEPGPASSRRSSPASDASGTSPALLMPWEQDEEDWSETLDP